MGNQLRLMIPTMTRTASVETRIEPRQPRRLEKKTNTAGRYPAPGSGTRRLVEMLQHVSLEVPPDEAERMIEFWRLLDFERVEAPDAIAQFVTWLQRDGTQIHLLHTEQATAPPLGHAAVVAADFDAAVGRLRDAGFEVQDAQDLWGASRAFALAPAGHRVEVMASPPS
jgi:catechol 2,3-dioxygenase-like lactoylglutathione lyase family enzyme